MVNALDNGGSNMRLSDESRLAGLLSIVLAIGFLLLLGRIVSGQDHDCLRYATTVTLTWNDDDLGRMDTTLTALSIKRDGNKWRILPESGPVIYCDKWVSKGESE
jgi:hypothetical protein